MEPNMFQTTKSITQSQFSEQELSLTSPPKEFQAFLKLFQSSKGLKPDEALKYIFFDKSSFCFYDDTTYRLHVSKGTKLTYTYKLKTDLVPNVQLRSHCVDSMPMEDLDAIYQKQSELIEQYTNDVINHQKEALAFLKAQRAGFVEKRNDYVSKNSHLANYFERTLYQKLRKQLGVQLNIPKEQPIQGKEGELCSNCRQSNQNRLYQCTVCDSFYLCGYCIELMKDMHAHEFFILRNKPITEVIHSIDVKEYDAEVVNKEDLKRITYRRKSNNYPRIRVVLKNKGSKEWTGKKVEMQYVEGDIVKNGSLTLQMNHPITKGNTFTLEKSLKDFGTFDDEAKVTKTLNLQCFADKKLFGEVIHLIINFE